MQVRFAAGHYRNGDHWTIPARTATVDTGSGTIAWPRPGLVPPFGVVRHRCVLGHVDVGKTGELTGLTDCRTVFPPLTAMRNLLYVGGDGQEGNRQPAGLG